MTKILLAVFLITGLFFIGCKKHQYDHSSPASPPASANSVSQAADTEQTICPVMGNPIDKNIFVEYQGKKVYLCCQQCKADFQKNPEKYLDKLPQFKK